MKKIIDIIAPASKCTDDTFKQGLSWLKQHKFIPHFGKDIVLSEDFFASSLKNQLADFKNAINNPDSDIIWCLRGGYGSMRLIPELKKLKKPKKKKIFLGFSDITALHLFLTQEWNWPTYHGPTLSQIAAKNQKAVDTLEVLELFKTGKLKNHQFKNLIPLNKYAKKDLEVTGKITGGNLKIVQTSLQTGYDIDTKNKIVFFEDVGERGYSIDRMLDQLYIAGKLKKNIKAVIFGDLSEGEEKDGNDLTNVAIRRFSERVDYPVLKGLPCGHTSLNRILPFNQQCTLSLGKKLTLKF